MDKKTIVICFLAAIVGVVSGAGIGKLFGIYNTAFYIALIGIACAELLLCFLGVGKKQA